MDVQPKSNGTPEERRAYRRQYMRHYRAKKRGKVYPPPPKPPVPDTQAPVTLADLPSAFEWIEANLRVPTGPLASKPFRIEPWQREWLVGAFGSEVREAGMSVARKNGKSGFIAAVLLCFLEGPLNRADWRAIVGSMTGLLAAELRDALLETAKASGIELRLKKAPPPGVVTGRRNARVSFLATDKGTGHAVGADLALIDEAGLMPEAQRAVWNALFTSVSGRDGRFWCISIQGTGPMFQEMEARDGSPKVFWRKWTAPTDCELDDEAAWHAANPGLAGGIKSISYMRDAAERAIVAAGNEMHFRAYDLNQPVDAERRVIVQVRDYKKCLADDPPKLEGDVILGIDLGATVSMTCAVALSLKTRTLKVWGAFSDDPPLSTRARVDRMGSLYDRMVREGELKLYPGRTTPVAPFLADVFGELMAARCRVIAIGCDRHRRAEAEQSFLDAGLPRVRVHWRGQGAAVNAHGSHDVRAFQRAILDRTLKLKASTMLESAIASSVLRFDNAGNPALDKAANNARIDALSAAVIACGIAEGINDAPLLRVSVV